MPAESRGEKRFKTVLAALIALVAILSALAAWRAADASSAASTADLRGMDAALNREGVRSVQNARAYQHYTAYTDFARYRQMGEALEDPLAAQSMATEYSSTDPRALELSHLRENAYDMASSSQFFFVTRYLQDNGYDRQRELSESWAEAARWQDLNPDPHFSLADQLRQKSTGMISTLIIFAAALWFYTVAGTLKHSLKYAALAAGVLCMLAGALLAVRIEWFL